MLQKQIIKFILVGVVNTIFYYILYSFFIFIGLKYFFAVTLATIFGVLFSYKTFSKMVFNQNKSSTKSLFKFISIYLVNIALNIFIIKLYLYIDTNLYIAGFVATVLVAIFSFFLNKFYVFKA